MRSWYVCVAERSGAVVPSFPKTRRHRFALENRAHVPVTLARYDPVLHVTDHDAYDDLMSASRAKSLVGARGAYLAPVLARIAA